MNSAPIPLKELLEAGVHFGHQTRRWNPKMKKFIFLERNGIYILDLQKTQACIEAARRAVRDGASAGGSVLFVGTKAQAKDIIREEADRCGQPWIIERWLGGLLTNFQTVKKSIRRLEDIEALETGEGMGTRSKKEAMMLGKERDRLVKVLGGIRNMQGLPAAIFVVDTRRERIAVAEAGRLRIPVVGMVDTNCDPDPVALPIPANDDAIRSIRLIAGVVADAVLEGRQLAARVEGVEFPAAAEVSAGMAESGQASPAEHSTGAA